MVESAAEMRVRKRSFGYSLSVIGYRLSVIGRRPWPDYMTTDNGQQARKARSEERGARSEERGARSEAPEGKGRRARSMGPLKVRGERFAVKNVFTSSPSPQTVTAGKRLNHFPFGTSGSVSSQSANKPSWLAEISRDRMRSSKWCNRAGGRLRRQF
jgi:hypothetical protein